MAIDSGVYHLTDRNLVLEIEDRFDLTGQIHYVLTGENGVGKTSFLEKILIPALEESRLDFLYIGQDIRNQLYTLRALLAAMGLSVIDADERELLRVWIANSPTARVLVMDEFDKYFSDYDFIFNWTKDAIHTAFVVSHRQGPGSRIDPSGQWQICRVQFTHAGQQDSLKKVRIRQEQL